MGIHQGTADRMQTLILLVCLTFPYWAPTIATCPAYCQSCDQGRVNCVGAGFTQVPSPMPDDALTVDLSQNEIESLRDMSNMQTVESFRISMNKIEVLTDDTFATMPLLMSLDLSMNKINKVRRNAFEGLTMLQSLSMNGNKLTSIKNIFAKTPKLQSLRLGNNEIESIEEDDFKENEMMRQLDLSNNKISSIHPDAFMNLKVLRYLILSNNPLGTLPEMTFGSTLLSLADFTNCALTNIPRGMPYSLKDFRLGNNMIMEIKVEDFENVTDVSLIVLNNNKIQHIEHRSFGKLENLKELWLTDNSMVYIPRGLPKSLQKLHMERNQIVELEMMLFPSGSKLKELSLESNKINKVHQDALKEVKNLEEIILQGNQISMIDVGTFKELPNLKMIKLTDNPIQLIEKGAFESLENLTELYMSYISHERTGTTKILSENFLRGTPNLRTLDLMSSVYLTEELLQLLSTDGFVMEKLQTLNLQYNELKTIQEGIEDGLPNIQNVFLDGNIFVCDSNLQWLKEWMQSSDVVFFQYEDPVCYKPASLKGVAIKDVADDAFEDLPEEQAAPSIDQLTAPSVETQPEPEQPAKTDDEKEGGRRNGRKERKEKPQEVETAERNTPPASQEQEKPPVRQPSNMAGTMLIIKPPKGSDPKIEERKRKKAEARAAAKARRKAAREAKKRKKEEAEKLKRARRHKKNGNRNKRNKRKSTRSRRHCQTDIDGKQRCRRRRKCTVNTENGNVECPKRGKKSDKGNKEDTKGKNDRDGSAKRRNRKGKTENDNQHVQV